MTTLAAPTSNPQSNIWWVFLLQGFAGIILGLMLLTNPGATVVAMVTFLGFYWFFNGILSLVRVFVDRSVPWVWSLFGGLFGVAAGLIVLRHPLLAAITVPTMLVIILGLEGLIIGVIDIIGGFKGGGVGSFLLGIVNIIVGLLLLGSPMAAALAVPFVFAVVLLVEGVALIIWAFRIRAS